LATLASPAAAESDEGSCGTRSRAAPAGPIDLEAIPMNEVAGPKAVQGAGDDDDECDGIRASGKTASDGVPAITTADADEYGEDDQARGD
jgi:hypothetical protein